MARNLMARKVMFRDLEREASESHLARLASGRRESIESSALHLDVLRDLRRINSHAVTPAYPILDAAGDVLHPADGFVVVGGKLILGQVRLHDVGHGQAKIRDATVKSGGTAQPSHGLRPGDELRQLVAHVASLLDAVEFRQQRRGAEKNIDRIGQALRQAQGAGRQPADMLG